MLRRMCYITSFCILFIILSCRGLAEVKTGKCGEDVYYSIDTATGVCVISGTGDMESENWPAAFVSDAYSIRSLIVKEGVTSIPHYAFHGCSRLTNVQLPSTLQSIDSFVFWDCKLLSDISMPDSVISLGAHVFDGCTQLREIHIPANLNSIGTGLFYNCTSLTDEFVSKITDPLFYSTSDTFSGCSSLSSVGLPDSLLIIGSNVFGRCVNLFQVDIPESVEVISAHAFTKCSSLSEIHIPKYVTTINEGAFSECSSLRNVYYDCTLFRLEDIAEKSNLMELENVVFHCTEADSDFLIKNEDGQQIILGYISGNSSVQIPERVDQWIMKKTYATLREVILPSSIDENCVFKLYVPNVYIMEGTTTTGQLSLYNAECIYIPQSIKVFDDLRVYSTSSQRKPTVYCYENSDAEIWALKNEYTIHYVTESSDWDVLSILDSLEWNNGTIKLDVGEMYTFDLNQFVMVPENIAGLVPVINEMPGFLVDGFAIQALIPGNYRIKIQMGGKTVQVPVHVYAPITSFMLIGPKLAKTNENISLSVINATPLDNSGRFTWQIDDNTIDETGSSIVVTTSNISGTMRIKAIASSGLEQEFVVWVASEISEPYVDAYARNAVTGGIIDILVDIDGMTYRNDSRTFKSIEINETSRHYIQKYNDCSLRVIKAGRSVFSVVGYDDKISDFLVVAHDPVGILSIPENCQQIESEAFCGVFSEKVIIPNGCESIQARAFADSNIKIIYIPDTVYSIDDNILQNCKNVTIICPVDSYAHWFAKESFINVVVETSDY